MSKPVVLFLCTGNSARSQMAEAFFRQHAGDMYDVHSAGMEPAGINPLTVRVMEEVGINLDQHRSKSVSEYLGNIAPPIVIFVCAQAEESCPRLWPHAVQTLCWPFEDPAACEGDDEVKLQKFREVRNQIEHQIQTWLREEATAVLRAKE